MTFVPNLKGYKLSFAKNAQKFLYKLDEGIAYKIKQKLRQLISGEANLNIKQMAGTNKTYRLKCGDYRIIYKINEEEIYVLVVKIGHRKDVYKNI
ncbi:type II toxin-antitoxin system RelE/ParE family toxin [Candidatus Babeliales bacterium]|nr:type II toxin-antitoxin system RelE/ParE family toxin [Candidatus Babeliales bacterium]MCF7899713.1 type II toxin-antitoxin system RelE/ParE family toxin [Candidatus Babeliales bacterium]